MTTGEKLRRAIGKKFGEVSQAEAARRLGVPPGNLSEWLSGKYEPTLSTLRTLAEGLTCNVTSLVGDGGKAS